MHMEETEMPQQDDRRRKEQPEDESEAGASGARYGRMRPEGKEDDQRYREAGGYGDAEHPRRWDRDAESQGPRGDGRMMPEDEWGRRQGRRRDDDAPGANGASDSSSRGDKDSESERRSGSERGAKSESRDRPYDDAGGYELSRGYRREDEDGSFEAGPPDGDRSGDRREPGDRVRTRN